MPSAVLEVIATYVMFRQVGSILFPPPTPKRKCVCVLVWVWIFSKMLVLKTMMHHYIYTLQWDSLYHPCFFQGNGSNAVWMAKINHFKMARVWPKERMWLSHLVELLISRSSRKAISLVRRPYHCRYADDDSVGANSAVCWFMQSDFQISDVDSSLPCYDWL